VVATWKRESGDVMIRNDPEEKEKESVCVTRKECAGIGFMRTIKHGKNTVLRTRTQQGCMMANDENGNGQPAVD
jgi:hypothetical protein